MVDESYLPLLLPALLPPFPPWLAPADGVAVVVLAGGGVATVDPGDAGLYAYPVAPVAACPVAGVLPVVEAPLAPPTPSPFEPEEPLPAASTGLARAKDTAAAINNVRFICHYSH